MLKKWKTLQGTKAKQKLTANSWKENSRESGQQAILNNQLQKSNQLVDRSKNSSRKDGISHKIGDHKHQFRRKDLGGSKTEWQSKRLRWDLGGSQKDWCGTWSKRPGWQSKRLSSLLPPRSFRRNWCLWSPILWLIPSFLDEFLDLSTNCVLYYFIILC